MKEQKWIEKALKRCHLTAISKVLDIPCGTGVMSKVFDQFTFRVAASDISKQMIDLAGGEYSVERFLGFVLADIENSPFANRTFDCVLSIGFMHRVPADIRKKALKELTCISRRYIIVTYSIDSRLQKLKHWLKKRIFPEYTTAPFPVPIHKILDEVNSFGLTIKKKFNVMSFLSAEVIFLLEKKK
jgi:ubiquinone/menaquinone biosynthesis C-methylase UbiE